MRTSCFLLLVGFALLNQTLHAEDSLKPVVAGLEGQRAFDDLAGWYDRGGTPPYEGALANLASEEVAERRKAGEYIYALFAQLLDDETNGRAKLYRLPNWGGGVGSPARDLRTAFAAKFAEKAEGIDALRAAKWLVEKETLAECQTQGIKALRRIKAPEVIKVFKKILSEPHPNGAVLAGAIDEIGERGLSALAPNVLRLQNHHRSAVRKAVRRAAAKLGIQEKILDFEPEKAFTRRLDQQLTKIRSMVLTEVPKDATWIMFEYTTYYGNGESYKNTYGAWLLREDKESYHVLDYYAQEWTPEKKNTKIISRSLVETAKALIELRKKDSSEARSALSGGGSLTRQFEPHFISVPELLVAAWSYERGDKRTAAAVLFPRIDETAHDRWIEWAGRDLLGHFYHKRMLNAFSYDRDYKRAKEIAEHLSQPQFDHYEYQQRARELTEQLPTREGDFKTFVLPSREEWTRLKGNMTRQEQIVYLTEHLRLLNCIQTSQPGDVDYRDVQYSVPHSRFWLDEKKLKPFEVINPYNELVGMKLIVRDLPILVPFLSDERFMPTFSFWRDFHYAHTLHRVNWAVTNVVNNVAKRYLVDVDDYEELDASGRKKYLQDIVNWCKANAGKTDEELILSTMRTSTWWRKFHASASAAVEKGYQSAFPILMERSKDFPKFTDDLAELAFGLNTADAVPAARVWLTNKDEAVRFWAALILLRHGNRDRLEGFADLKAIVDKDNRGYWHARAVDGLLATKNEQAMALASSILKKEGFSCYGPGKAILRRLFLAGRKECLDYLLAKLSGVGNTSRSSNRERDEVARIVAEWRTDQYEYNTSLPAKEKEERRKELKKWLIHQFERVRQGKKPDIRTDLRDIQFPEARFDAP